jgi:hypothetical protein
MKFMTWATNIQNEPSVGIAANLGGRIDEYKGDLNRTVHLIERTADSQEKRTPEAFEGSPEV